MMEDYPPSYQVLKIEGVNQVAELFPGQFVKAQKIILKYVDSLERKHIKHTCNRTQSRTEQIVLDKLDKLYETELLLVERRDREQIAHTTDALEGRIDAMLEGHTPVKQGTGCRRIKKYPTAD